MTDHATPDHELELLSAYIDGEATAEEVARIRADPDLAARAEALRSGTRVAALAPPAGVAETHVAAALAAFDTLGPAGDRSAAAPVVPLPTRTRTAWYQQVPLPAVAAVFLLVALVGALALLGRDSGDVDTAADATASLEADDSGGAAGSAADGADEGAAEAYARPSFRSTDEFADYAAGLAAPASTTAPSGTAPAPEDTDTFATDDASTPDRGSVGSGSGDGCDAVAVAGVDPATVEAVIFAVVDDREVTGVLATDGDRRRLVVVDDATCAVVDERMV